MLNINPVFESKFRIAIINELLSGEKTFTGLKDSLQMTDGNLTTHLNKMIDAKVISCNREKKESKKISIFTLTNHGKQEFIDYAKLISGIAGINVEKRRSRIDDEIWL